MSKNILMIKNDSKLKLELENVLVKEAMINAILEEYILIKLHKKLLTGGNS